MCQLQTHRAWFVSAAAPVPVPARCTSPACSLGYKNRFGCFRSRKRDMQSSHSVNREGGQKFPLRLRGRATPESPRRTIDAYPDLRIGCVALLFALAAAGGRSQRAGPRHSRAAPARLGWGLAAPMLPAARAGSPRRAAASRDAFAAPCGGVARSAAGEGWGEEGDANHQADQHTQGLRVACNETNARVHA